MCGNGQLESQKNVSGLGIETFHVGSIMLLCQNSISEKCSSENHLFPETLLNTLDIFQLSVGKKTC